MRACVLVVLAACGGSGNAEIDAAVPRPDAAGASMDSMPDAPIDSMPDASMDAMPDAPIDSMPDASMDAMPDASIDAMPDASIDAMPDASMDAMPDAALKPGRLVVQRTGGGVVVDTSGPINCGPACSGDYAAGTQVTLIVNQDAVSQFVGWSGPCSGTGTCTFVIDGDITVGATFSSCPGVARGASLFGGPGDERLLAVAALNGGGSVAVGFASEGTFGGPALGGRDAVVARFDASRTPVWTKRFGGGYTDVANAVAVAPDGDILVAGSFTGIAAVGASVLVGQNRDAFVAKLAAADGTVLWVKRFGGAYIDEAFGIASSPGGDIAVVGRFNGPAAFGSIMLAASPTVVPGTGDAFIARLDPSGTVRWANRVIGDRMEVARRVAFDANGDVVFAGEYFQGATFDSIALPDGLDPNNEDMFVAKAAGASGAAMWVHTFGPGHPSSGVQDLSGVLLLEPSGSIVFLGTLFRAEYWDYYGPGGILEARLSSAGAVISERVLAVDQVVAVNDAVQLPNGDLLVAGAFANIANLGTGSLWNTVEDGADWSLDGFLARWPVGGTPTLVQPFGGRGRDEAIGLALTAADQAVVVGRVAERVDLCTGALSSAGAADALLVQIGTTAGTGAPTLLQPQPIAPVVDPGPTTCVPPGPAMHGLAAAAPSYSQLALGGPTLMFANGVAGDFDADGDQDMLVHASTVPGDEHLLLYRNTADVLTASPLSSSDEAELDGALPSRVLVADFDGDGDLDAVLPQFGIDTPPFAGAQSIMIEQQPSGLHDTTWFHLPRVDRPGGLGAAQADIDCDGDRDVTLNGMVYRNDGSGHFAVAQPLIAPWQGARESMVFCDVDRDGDADIIEGTGSAAQFYDGLWINDGHGRFTAKPDALPVKAVARAETQAVVCADFDGDGWNDVVTMWVGPNNGAPRAYSLWLNHGDGTFDDRTSTGLPQTIGAFGDLYVHAVDLNADGWTDILGSGGNIGVSHAFLNDGDGTFSELSPFLPIVPGSALVPIDIDGNGRTDLVGFVVNGASQVFLQSP